MVRCQKRSDSVVESEIGSYSEGVEREIKEASSVEVNYTSNKKH